MGTGDVMGQTVADESTGTLVGSGYVGVKGPVLAVL